MQNFPEYLCLNGRERVQAIFLKHAEIFSVKLQEILLKNTHYLFVDCFSNFSEIFCIVKNIYLIINS